MATKVGLEVCEALGIDPYDVTHIDIFLGINKAATINIERYLKSSEVGNLAKILEKYEITKVKDGN